MYVKLLNFFDSPLEVMVPQDSTQHKVMVVPHLRDSNPMVHHPDNSLTVLHQVSYYHIFILSIGKDRPACAVSVDPDQACLLMGLIIIDHQSLLPLVIDDQKEFS